MPLADPVRLFPGAGGFPLDPQELFGRPAPLVIEVEVASNVSPSHVFTEADFEPYTPGQMILAAKEQVRFRLFNWFERKVTFKRFRWRRFCCPVCCCCGGGEGGEGFESIRE